MVPVAALEEIFAWLGEGDRLDRVPPAPAPFEPTSLEIQPETGAQTARETACLFGPQERLFGILTEPASGARPGDPAVILLNVGSNTHVGPHRMNVELAREMASLGFTALRMDASGLGESPAAAGTSENRIYTLDAVGDVQAAMSAISRATGAERFVLVGLCSGAYLAFHTAVADPRVIGQVLLSPYAFEWKEGDPVAPQERKGAQAYRSTRFYLKAVLDPRAWWLVLQGKVNVTGIASAILERAFERIEGALPGLSALIRRQQPPQSPIERSFRALCDRGVQTLMVLAFDDGGLDMVARYLGKDARRLRGQSRFALQILGSVDHTFTTLASQQLLHQTLTRYLSEHFS